MKPVSTKKAKRPMRAQATLKKERGVWVYQGTRRRKISAESLQKQIEVVRERKL